METDIAKPAGWVSSVLLEFVGQHGQYGYIDNRAGSLTPYTLLYGDFKCQPNTQECPAGSDLCSEILCFQHDTVTQRKDRECGKEGIFMSYVTREVSLRW